MRAHPRPDASPGRHRRAKRARPTALDHALGRDRLRPALGSVGIAADKTSKAKAEQAALEHCASKGGKSCETNITYYNQCVAVVYGPSPTGAGILMNSASAETKELAQSLAIETRERHGHELQDLPYRLQLPGAISMTRRR